MEKRIKARFNCFKLPSIILMLCLVLQVEYADARSKSSIGTKKVKKKITLNWLKFPTETLLYWNVKKADKPNYLRLEPRWKNKNKEVAPKKIFGLMSKKSKSYKLAVEKLLQILVYKEMYAHVTLANFGNDEERGKEAIQYAKDSGMDIIYSMGSETASLLYRLYRGVDKIPVVAAICKDPVLLGQTKDYKSGTGTNIAFTSLNVPLDIKLNYLKQLMPNLKNIGLMYDSTHKQVMQVEVIPAKHEFKKRGIRVYDIAVESREGASKILGEKIPQVVNEMWQSDPLFKNSIFWITSSTAIFSNIKIISKVSGQVPVLSSIPNVVSEGDASAVLGIGVDRRHNAHIASLYVVKILTGEAKVGDLPVGVVTPPDIAINFRVASRISLKIPFRFFESASFIYDYEGKVVRAFGQRVNKDKEGSS